MARLYQIDVIRRTDPAADKKALETEYGQLIERVEQDLPAINEAAEKAYLEAPNKDKELSSFLMGNLMGYMRGDEFENAARVAGILTDNNLPAKELNMLAGISFFAVNDYDNAEKFLKLARHNHVTNATATKCLDQIDHYREMWAEEQAYREAEDKAHNLPKVRLTTTKGTIVVELFENEAPIATANFISLVEKKFYDGTPFHRVISSFMAQAGASPEGGGPGYTIPCECYNEKHRNHFRGSLSMAHTGQRDSGGSQFFLMLMPASHLDGKHTVFGRIVEGLDVLAKLKRIQPGEPGTPDKIVKATVIYKRPHAYKPVTRPEKK